MNKNEMNLGAIVNGSGIGFSIKFADAKQANHWKRILYHVFQAQQYEINNRYGVFDDQQTRELIK